MTPEKMRALQHKVNYLETHNEAIETEMKKQVMDYSLAKSSLEKFSVENARLIRLATAAVKNYEQSEKLLKASRSALTKAKAEIKRLKA